MKYDVVNPGEVLIDLTQTGMEGGLSRYAANPGGAPPMRRRPAPGWDVKRPSSDGWERTPPASRPGAIPAIPALEEVGGN